MTKAKSSNQTCYICGHEFQHCMSTQKAKAYRANIENAVKVTNNRLNAFAEAWAAGDAEACDQLIHELLTCKKSKLAGAMRYAMKQPLDGRPTIEELVRVPKKLDLTQPIKECARVSAQKKSGREGWRPIADFGIQHRTAQHMVKAILERTFVPRRFQQEVVGVPKAVARIRAQANAGHHFFVHQDIADFFLHFKAEKLEVASPLPNWAVEHVVTGRHNEWAVRGKSLSQYGAVCHSLSTDALVAAARRGAPQGSSCSSIIALLECSKLQLSEALEKALTNHADDFLSLHCTQQDAESAAEELEGAVAQLPGGDFTLKTKSMGDLSEGCEFLGHQFRLIDGVVRISPSEINNAQLVNELFELEEGCGVHSSHNPDKAEVLWAAANATSYLSSWWAAFAECDDIYERRIKYCEGQIQDMLDKVHATKADLVGIPATKKFKLRSWPPSRYGS